MSQDIPKQTTTPAATTDSRAEDAYDSMSAAEKKALADAGAAWTEANKAWEAAKAEDDQALMDYYQALKDKAHADAEAIRLNYGFSGGDDGTGYYERPLEEELLPELPMEQPVQNYDLTEYLKQLYAAQVEAQLAGLKGAYEKSVAGYDAQLEQLPRVYDEARNKLAAQDAIARKSFDERAAANGLNSGTGGQVELARSSAFRRDLAGLDQAQAEAVSGLELEKTNLKAQYESALAQAEAEGNAALASALYEELVRVQGLQRDDAQQAAAQQAEALEQALKNGTGLISSVGSTGTKTPGSTPTPASPPGKGYDNGSLSTEQVKALQAFYGVAQDGMWGPNSQKVSGLSANEAWQRYLNYGRTGGQGGSADGDYGSMSYDPDEGVFSWAGKGYYDLNTLVQDIAKVEAQLTAAQKKQIQDELAVWGFEIRFE